MKFPAVSEIWRFEDPTPTPLRPHHTSAVVFICSTRYVAPATCVQDLCGPTRSCSRNFLRDPTVVQVHRWSRPCNLDRAPCERPDPTDLASILQERYAAVLYSLLWGAHLFSVAENSRRNVQEVAVPAIFSAQPTSAQSIYPIRLQLRSSSLL